jgi:hypothetical protein
MLYREIIAVCFQIHTKHINTLCGQNVELLNVKLVVYIVTTGLERVSNYSRHNVRPVLGVTLDGWADTWRNTADSDPSSEFCQVFIGLSCSEALRNLLLFATKCCQLFTIPPVCTRHVRRVVCCSFLDHFGLHIVSVVSGSVNRRQAMYV